MFGLWGVRPTWIADSGFCAVSGSKRVPPNRDTAPVVQKLRLKYAKRGRLRFSSHRDFQRALERALRRSHIPMGYSAGFSPHPKISYANSAPTGTASEAEFVEIGLVEPMDPERVRMLLDEALPPGLDIVEVVEAKEGDFAHRLEASEWQIALPGVPHDLAQAAVEGFLSATEIEVSRRTKTGMRSFDARGPVLALEVTADDDGCAILTAIVRHVTPAVRPDDLLSALANRAQLVPPVPAVVTRLAQGPLVGRGNPEITGSPSIGDPFAPDR